jgi:hypothetical protein
MIGSCAEQSRVRICRLPRAVRRSSPHPSRCRCRRVAAKSQFWGLITIYVPAKQSPHIPIRSEHLFPELDKTLFAAFDSGGTEDNRTIRRSKQRVDGGPAVELRGHAEKQYKSQEGGQRCFRTSTKTSSTLNPFSTCFSSIVRCLHKPTPLPTDTVCM